MIFIRVLLATALTLPALALPAALAAGPSGFNVTSLSFTGTACPPGSAKYVVNDDGSAITAIFSEFAAQTGPSVDPSLNYRSCKLTYETQAPAGYRFSVLSVFYQGLVSLGSEVKANFFATYSVNSEKASAYSPYTGPVAREGAGGYGRTDLFDFDPHSACGGKTTLTAEPSLKVDNSAIPTESALLTADTVDLNLLWEKC